MLFKVRLQAIQSSIAGDLPQFEEISRALFASEWTTYATSMTDWPPDIRRYALHLANLND
jgi:hypothetical protein